jgi:hypothetical protein
MTTMYKPQVIAFPDVEAIVRTYLVNATGEIVTTAVDNPRAAKFVRIVRTGGPRVDLVTEQAQLTVECWADSSVTAAALARTVRAHLGAIQGRVPGIHGFTEAGGPQNMPDEVSKQARYRWTVLFDVRGSVLT